MKPFLVSKRKLLDLGVLVILNFLVYFVWDRVEVVTLFTLGFIWNWVASQDMNLLFENRRYRFSMLKMVMNLQSLALKPFAKFPPTFQRFVRIFPAGIFWTMVILFNSSHMPWWATFAGSFAFELLQIEWDYIARHKESPL